MMGRNSFLEGDDSRVIRWRLAAGAFAGCKLEIQDDGLSGCQGRRHQISRSTIDGNARGRYHRLAAGQETERQRYIGERGGGCIRDFYLLGIARSGEVGEDRPARY